MGAFADSVRSNSIRILEEINKQCHSITFQLFTAIVRRSPSPSNPGPYAEGLLVNQWYPMAGSSFSTQVGSATSPNGSGSLARINAIMNSRQFYRKDGVMTMANNLDYAVRAERIGWLKSDNPAWKNAKPYRMVALSLQEVAARNRK